MPLEIKVQLGDDVFEASGDFEFNESFSAVFRQFVNAVSEQPALFEALAEQLENQTAELEKIVLTFPSSFVNPEGE